MTAREQTRKAIADCLRSRRGAPEGSLPPRIDHLTDAASDVWEPLLQAAVALIGFAIDQQGGDSTKPIEGSTYKRLVDALG